MYPVKRKKNRLLLPMEKWDRLKRELKDNLRWYREELKHPGKNEASYFYLFTREVHTESILGYMEYLEGKENANTELLFALLGPVQ